MEYGLSPYRNSGKKSSFKLPEIKVPRSLKKWGAILLGFIFLIFLSVYLMLGDLRFFANHFLGLSFFSKHYVVLLQNNYELRPNGGFITAFGDLDVFMGIPKNLSFKNSYEIDTKSYVTPPKAQEELLKNESYQGYTFRDANWNPDFPQSQKELAKFYQDKFPGQDVDGMVVVNFSLIEDLIDRLGGIELNGKKFDKKNLFSALEFEVNNIDRHNIDNLMNRKSILGDLAAALISKAKRHPFIARDTIVDGLNNKNMFAWLKDNGLEEKLIKKGWANSLTPVENSDFLAVNLANLGSKKADRYLQTEVNYYANITREVPEITTEVTIRYPGFTNTYADNYKGYLRLYIPKNSDVTSTPVDSATTTEGEFKVIGSKIILPAGSKMNLAYVYTLPRNTLVHDEYKLRLIKQSGADTLYNVTVEAAEGKIVQSKQFEGLENRGLFTGKLINDLDLSLTLAPDSLPPYPIEQEFEDLSHIKIIWNKPIDPIIANNSANYTVADLNKNDPNTNEVKVLSAELTEPNIVRLELQGITEQKLEYYRLDLKNIKDLAGNVILPNPKSITVVQRIKPKAVEPAFQLPPAPAPAPAPAPTPAPLAP